MNTDVVNIKIDKKTKKEARRLAEELGLSLSAIIKAYLRQFVRTKKVFFSTEEEPTEYMLKALKESKEDIKAGRVKSFDNIDKALEFFKTLKKNENKKD